MAHNEVDLAIVQQLLMKECLFLVEKGNFLKGLMIKSYVMTFEYLISVY